jgi:hypothetical protein
MSQIRIAKSDAAVANVISSDPKQASETWGKKEGEWKKQKKLL